MTSSVIEFIKRHQSRNCKRNGRSKIGRLVISQGKRIKTSYVNSTLNFESKALHESVTDWFAHLGVLLRAALSTAAELDEPPANTDHGIDPDFDGWLHGDPSVTKNPTSRYGDRTPGYIMRNPAHVGR